MDDALEKGLAWIRRELRIVQLLFDISQALSKSLDFGEMAQPVLKKMAEHMGMVWGAIVLLNPDSGEIEIKAIYGPPGNEQLGKRAGDKVMEKGFPAIVDKVSGKLRFIDKAREIRRNKDNFSLICVPIRNRKGVIGTLSADRLSSQDFSLEEDVRLLTIIASLVAQAADVRRDVLDRERMLREENQRLHSEILDHFKPVNILGNSHAIRQVHRLVNQVSASLVSVLITGESGAGKGLVAEAIHANSLRAEKPYIRMDLAALPASMIEGELFGYEQGAFRGALTSRKGSLEMADGGTLFIDAVDKLPLATQAKLAHSLQEKEFERLGGSKSIKVDVRIISATHCNLEELIDSFGFRPDLYYRLNIFPIFVPPLRERKTDILLLADYFAEQAGKRQGKNIHGISSSATELLLRYRWPGNVRELENCIESAVRSSTDGILHENDLPLMIRTAKTGANTRATRINTSPAAIRYLDALKIRHR